jgi:hypothetical protein
MDVPSRFLHRSWSRRRAGIAASIAAFSGRIQGKTPGLGQRHLGAGEPAASAMRRSRDADTGLNLRDGWPARLRIGGR